MIRPHQRARLVLAALGLYSVVLYVATVVIVVRHGTKTRDLGWSATAHGHDLVVESVDPDGPAAGILQPGNRIVSISGCPHLSPNTLQVLLDAVEPGQVFEATIERNGAEIRVPLRWQVTQDRWQTPRLLASLLVALAFLALALFVGWLRPEATEARLLVASGVTSGFFFLWSALAFTLPFHGPIERFFTFLTVSLHPLEFTFGFHLFKVFPQRLPRSLLRKLPLIALYVVAISVAMARVARWLFAAQPPEVAAQLFSRYAAMLGLVGLIFRIFLVAAPGLICLILIAQWRCITTNDQRRRLRIVLLGCGAGIAPWLLAEIAAEMLSFNDRASLMLADFATVATILVPLSLAYAVVKHRVFGINVFVRTGVQYLLAMNTLRLAIALPVTILAVRIASKPELPVGRALFGRPLEPILLILAMLTLHYRTQIFEWIDRRFFRDSHHRKQVLLRLIEEVRDKTSINQIGRLLSLELTQALHPKLTQVFFRRSERPSFELGYSSMGDTEVLQLDTASPLVTLIGERAEVIEAPFDRHTDLAEREVEWLQRIEIDLIVPMMASDLGLIGAVLLGEKRSEEPYTASDKRLLEAVASQVAIAYENVLLKEQVNRDQRLRHDVLAHLGTEEVRLVRECPECNRCFDLESHCPEDGCELSVNLPVQRLLDGRYRLDLVLGRGGMGSVYLAHDERLQRDVAVKVLVGRLFGNQDAIHRFSREARAAARLRHPNIVAVYDYGRAGAEGAYLVMELVLGPTLQERLVELGPVDPPLAADWLDQIFDGVGAAHAAGIIHRDLKPANVLMDSSSDRTVLKIADFGLAKIQDRQEDGGSSLTAPGAILGSFAYMSLEQLSGERVDARADLFSLGVVAYEILLGRRPFPGRTPQVLFSEILKEPPQFPSPSSPDHAALFEILGRCLASDREKRYPSVQQLRQELIGLLQQIGPGPIES